MICLVQQQVMAGLYLSLLLISVQSATSLINADADQRIGNSANKRISDAPQVSFSFNYTVREPTIANSTTKQRISSKLPAAASVDEQQSLLLTALKNKLLLASANTKKSTFETKLAATGNEKIGRTQPFLSANTTTNIQQAAAASNQKSVQVESKSGRIIARMQGKRQADGSSFDSSNSQTNSPTSSRRNEDPWFLDQTPYPLQPYRFVYNIKGKNGQTEQYRQEVGDGKFLSGSYGYVLPDGIYRHVDYVADDRGFRAFIRTSEPGTANQNPSNVVINSNPVSVAGVSYANIETTGAGQQQQQQNARNNPYIALTNTQLPYNAVDLPRYLSASELARGVKPPGAIVNNSYRNFTSLTYTTPSPLLGVDFGSNYYNPPYYNSNSNNGGALGGSPSSTITPGTGAQQATINQTLAAANLAAAIDDEIHFNRIKSLQRQLAATSADQLPVAPLPSAWQTGSSSQQQQQLPTTSLNNSVFGLDANGAIRDADLRRISFNQRQQQADLGNKQYSQSQPGQQQQLNKLLYDRPLSVQGGGDFFPGAANGKLTYDNKHIFHPELPYLSVERARNLAQIDQMNAARRARLRWLVGDPAIDGAIGSGLGGLSHSSTATTSGGGGGGSVRTEERHERHQSSQSRFQDDVNKILVSKEHQSGTKSGSGREFEYGHHHQVAPDGQRQQVSLLPPPPPQMGYHGGGGAVDKSGLKGGGGGDHSTTAGRLLHAPYHYGNQQTKGGTFGATATQEAIDGGGGVTSPLPPSSPLPPTQPTGVSGGDQEPGSQQQQQQQQSTLAPFDDSDRNRIMSGGSTSTTPFAPSSASTSAATATIDAAEDGGDQKLRHSTKGDVKDGVKGGSGGQRQFERDSRWAPINEGGEGDQHAPPEHMLHPHPIEGEVIRNVRMPGEEGDFSSLGGRQSNSLSPVGSLTLAARMNDLRSMQNTFGLPQPPRLQRASPAATAMESSQLQLAGDERLQSSLNLADQIVSARLGRLEALLSPPSSNQVGASTTQQAAASSGAGGNQAASVQQAVAVRAAAAATGAGSTPHTQNEITDQQQQQQQKSSIKARKLAEDHLRRNLLSLNTGPVIKLQNTFEGNELAGGPFGGSGLGEHGSFAASLVANETFDARRLPTNNNNKSRLQAEKVSELEKFQQRLRTQQLLLEQTKNPAAGATNTTAAAAATGKASSSAVGQNVTSTNSRQAASRQQLQSDAVNSHVKYDEESSDSVTDSGSQSNRASRITSGTGTGTGVGGDYSRPRRQDETSRMLSANRQVETSGFGSSSPTTPSSNTTDRPPQTVQMSATIRRQENSEGGEAAAEQQARGRNSKLTFLQHSLLMRTNSNGTTTRLIEQPQQQEQGGKATMLSDFAHQIQGWPSLHLQNNNNNNNKTQEVNSSEAKQQDQEASSNSIEGGQQQGKPRAISSRSKSLIEGTLVESKLRQQGGASGQPMTPLSTASGNKQQQQQQQQQPINTINLDFINSVTALSVDQLNPFAISSVNPAILSSGGRTTSGGIEARILPTQFHSSSSSSPENSRMNGVGGIATSNARYFSSPELLAALNYHERRDTSSQLKSLLGGASGELAAPVSSSVAAVAGGQQQPAWASNHRFSASDSAGFISSLQSPYKQVGMSEAADSQHKSFAPMPPANHTTTQSRHQQQASSIKYPHEQQRQQSSGALTRDGFEIRDRALQVDNHRFYEVVSTSANSAGGLQQQQQQQRRLLHPTNEVASSFQAFKDAQLSISAISSRRRRRR